MNLQGLLIQSSNLFSISSVQFSSLGTCLSGKFVQFSSWQRGQVPPFSSVQFTPLSSRTLSVLFRIDLADLQGLLVQSFNWFGIDSVQFSSLGTSLSGKFVQFCSGHRAGAKYLRSVLSVQFIQFSLRTLPALDSITSIYLIYLRFDLDATGRPNTVGI